MKALRSPNLAIRLSAVGVVQLAAVALMAVCVGFVVAQRSRRVDMLALTERIEARSSDAVALRTELTTIARQDEVQVSVYGADRRLIASNLDPPLPLYGPGTAHAVPGFPPPFAPQAEPGGHRPQLLTQDAPLPLPDGVHPPRLASPGAPPPEAPSAPENVLLFAPSKGAPPRVLIARLDSGGHVVARFEPQRPGLWTALLILGSGLGVVGIGAVLMARFITRPITRLSTALRAFGEGDLRARAALQRNDEIGALGSRFDEMADRIQALLRTEEELLANVAHELRTPMARIRVALDIAEESEAENIRASLREIGVDLKELETLVDDILTAARLSLNEGKASGSTLALRKEPTATRELAERAAQRFNALNPARPLAVELASDLPKLDVDPALFRRALDNLLDNAHKYTPDLNSPITLHASREASGVRFDVVDSGLGIAETERPRLFTPFFRTGRSRSRATGGVGLGLTLTKRIVDAHLGSIDIESQEGVGTRVVVRVPAAET